MNKPFFFMIQQCLYDRIVVLFFNNNKDRIRG